MSAPSTQVVNTEIEPLALESLESMDSVEPETAEQPKRQAWRRLEEIEDERRLRDELADWEDFTVEN